MASLNSIKCAKCKSEFKDYLSNNRKYCSRKCAYSTFVVDHSHICEECKEMFTNKKKGSKYCSFKCTGLANRAKLKGRVAWNKGTKYLAIRGENHWNWQGDRTRLVQGLRKTPEYKDWRTAVFKRDNYTCQDCGVRGVKLIADHIKAFAKYPDLRLDINNGRSLCVECNYQTTYVRQDWRTT